MGQVSAWGVRLKFMRKILPDGTLIIDEDFSPTIKPDFREKDPDGIRDLFKDLKKEKPAEPKGNDDKVS